MLMPKMLQLWTLLTFISGSCTASPLGKKFVTVFMQNDKADIKSPTLHLYLNGYSNSTSVTVSVNSFKYETFMIIPRNFTFDFKVPIKIELSGSNVSSNVVIIRSDKDISVLSMNYKPQSADSSIVYPLKDHGTEYYVVTPSDGSSGGFKEFAVVSNEESTQVNISLKGTVTYQNKVFISGSILTITLSPYTVIQLQSKDNLSGTRVVSTKPVAVLSGHTCVWKNGNCNHVYEQLRPVSSWGTTFVVAPVEQAQSDIVYVVASKNTQVDYTTGESTSTNLVAGEVMQIDVASQTPLYITASAGIQVVYYGTGWQKLGIQYDQLFMTVPPISSYCLTYEILSPLSFNNFAVIVAKTSATSKLTWNGGKLTKLLWKQIPGTDYSWTTYTLLPIVLQFVEIKSSPFLLMSYGFSTYNSYGSPAICTDANVTPACDTVKCRAQEKCQLSNGQPTCVPMSEVFCHAVGDPHYRTFDGKFYDFQGTCTYIIAKTCGKDSSLPAFKIETKNENRGNTRVSYISYVTVKVYEFVISVARSEIGFVRVNNQLQHLPINLNNGQVQLYHFGAFLVAVTDFNLKVLYDWNYILRIYISSSYFENVCGMCGYYNGNPTDDLAMPAGNQASDLVEFGKSWKGEDEDEACWHDCNGECEPCPKDLQQSYLTKDWCGLISNAINGPFRQCHKIIPPNIYVENCVYDVCQNGGSKQIFCQSLAIYASVCQRNNIEIGEWRNISGCQLPCPANSQYKLCGKGCPPTCNDAAVPLTCSALCVETCQCNDGFVLDAATCKPKDKCGCIFEGKLYAPNENFWEDNECMKRCTCNPITKKVDCKDAQCKATEKCSVVKGIRDCYPISYGTCTGSGDPHYVTFDDVRYDFQGTCVYLFAGLCNKTEDLVDFQIYVQNENRGKKMVAYTREVRVNIYDFNITISRQELGKIQLNGVLINLPFIVDKGKMSVYRVGYNAILQTKFGLQVSFNWGSRIAVKVPNTYAGALCGLCGNFDGDKKNEFVVNNNISDSPTDFGKRWKVQNTSECSEEDKASCIKKIEMEQHYRESHDGCGILLDKNGPFHNCHAKIDPEGRFKDCVFDACFYSERQDILCTVIASYVTSCQEAGVMVDQWRTATFCSPKCGINSHYEVCATGCAPTCVSLSPPLDCNPVCSEGCVCDDGFILSGDDCVPISQCGCTYQDLYYKPGEQFFPNELCNLQCECIMNGMANCTTFSCGPNEECKVIDGVRKCYPIGSAQCSAAGASHYMSLDGLAFEFQGTCTYTLTKTITTNANLVPFDVKVKNENGANGQVVITKLVSIEVYGYILVLQYTSNSQVEVNGVFYNLPLTLEDGKIRVYQNGNRVIIDTDFGVQVSYDLVSHVIVTVPGNYKGNLGGLCGNYNGNKTDEFQLPSKTLVSDATIFGAAWKVRVPDEVCNDGCGNASNPCPVCDNNKQEVFKSSYYCGFLNNSSPLSSCYATIDPKTYFSACISDLCASLGDLRILCQNVQRYVAACQAVGITIQPWRTEAFCPYNCPPNSHYKICADVCTTACASINNPAKCPTTCSEGCQCDDDYFFDGKGCVFIEKCGCFENGRYYKPNEKVLSSNCKEVCTCGPLGVLSCENTSCASDETCQIKNGIVTCVNKDPCKFVNCKRQETCKIKNGNPFCEPNFSGTCWACGDPHYRTFDNYYYDFQGTCTYILSRYIGDDASLVPFTVEEKNENIGNKAVSYVRAVSIYVYEYKISIVKGEFGKVRVNDIITNLPVTLLGGKISAGISGLSAVVRTDFGLQVTYEYKWHVAITLTSSYYGLTGGLCGNFNQNNKDDMITIDNKATTSIVDWAKSWKVNNKDPLCFDICPGTNCPTCGASQKTQYRGENQCGLISKVLDGPFRECHPKVSPEPFLDNCLYDVCINGGAKVLLCQALSAYDIICRKQGVKIYDWRKPSGCALPCPLNSHYEVCGSACPATCANLNATVQCPDNCVETCQCNEGYVLSGDTCVRVASCGLIFNDNYHKPNETFWYDPNCKVLCSVSPNLGMVVCKESKCKQDEECRIVNGIRGCQPLMFSTCSGTGDPHYKSFDGKRFDFMGTCTYQLVDVTSNDPSLTHFTVKVQNNNRGNRAVSHTKVVTVEVYNLVLTLSRDYPRRILINGIISSLPFSYQGNKVVSYISGNIGVIKTIFHVSVTFDWNSNVAVTVPSSYSNAVAGLCGNYNTNSGDDFNMKDGKSATSAVEFGNSWKVGDVPGCSLVCAVNCSQCPQDQKQSYVGEKYCGLITKSNGPFSECLSVVDPTPFFNDCIYDACQYQGHPSSFCSVISLYVAACQAAEVVLQEWRSDTFCPPSCPPNSHYELCENACPVTCKDLSSPADCDSPCREACYCDNGFILSGDQCVPIAQCGCVYLNRYYKKDEVFFPKGQCSEKCQCEADGVVQCQPESCRFNEECKVVNGVLGCFGRDYATCVATGEPHYISLDGHSYDFQGTCTYILAKTVVKDPRLVSFSVVTENDRYEKLKVSVPKLVIVSVYSFSVAIQRGMKWKVKVDGEVITLPLTLLNGKISINQEGGNIVLRTDFGLRVLYDTVYHVILEVPSSYFNKVGGLCGNFNGDPNDDFQLPDTNIVKKVAEFGAAWAVNITGVRCSNGCEEVECTELDNDKKKSYMDESHCGMITNHKGPFNACHVKVNPDQYYTFCIYDVAMLDGKDDILCKSLQAYATACHSAGVNISGWRTPTFCAMSCPENSHYELCTRTCDNICYILSSETKCAERCFEGCECDAGYLFDAGKCVTMEKCGCVFEGRYLQDGETFVNADCSKQCKCQFGGVICQSISCQDNEKCKVRNGMRYCYKVQADCLISSQTFVSFDGVSGGLVPLGPIVLTSLCNIENDTWFRVLADVQSCGANAKFVNRLHIFLLDAIVTISKDKEAWVNGRLESLPVTVSGILSASVNGASIVVQISTYLTVELSESGELKASASERIPEALCGACGNFNAFDGDDLLTPDGKTASDIQQLLRSWRGRDLYSCGTEV